MLDNPIWSALTTHHAHLAAGDAHVKRYPADVAPFVATDGDGSVPGAGPTDLATPDEVLYLFGADLSPPRGWAIERRPPLIQMVLARRPVEDGEETREDLSVLGPGDVPEMLDLTSLAFPGYFRTRTIVLGTYLGIRREGRLIAMAGERLGFGAYREVSGICTHPDHRGRGHSRRLVSRLLGAILARGETPFLHVSGENDVARHAYERLGFVVRRELEFLRARRPSPAGVGPDRP